MTDFDRSCPDCGGPLDLDMLDCERHEMHRAGGDRRAGEAKVTAAGLPERRRHDRRARQRRRDEQDREPVTRGDFRRRGRNDRLLFLALAVVSCLAAYLGYNAGQNSQEGLKRNGTQATFDTCVSGGELRIVVAQGLDDLRSLAIRRDVPKAVREEFIAVTQPAIDRLLSQAAGRTFHAPLPPGAVTPSVVRLVRALSMERCMARAGRVFGSTATTP